ncbi:DUF1269 domain-containing protein [Dyadobacter sp. 3J3]|uniref:DUF1269 domain-containing protein n=1 Tax=Dyadobacter sp. 3J3 TaxID=2606600 RepID=UPI0013577A7C|nr:DUF1269 domain-containing protein [Dyadobacter sp. 3J3]
MTKIIVISFDQESKAIEALHKLAALESYGDITVYEKTMVRKLENGHYEILKQEESQGWKTLEGMAVGSLLGMLAGPVGFVIGLYTGAAIGLVSEIREYNFEADFIAKTEQGASAGTVSIIAEIDEDSNVFIDEAVKTFGGTISRSDVDFEFDHYANEKLDELDDQINAARVELKKSAGEAREKVTKKIAKLKETRRQKFAELIARSEKEASGAEDKVKKAIHNAKTEIASASEHVSAKIKETEVDLIKKRITRQEIKLTKLNDLLKEALV